MQRFIARQPIFDRQKKLYAYELLFRSGLENAFRASDADMATSRVITDSLLLFGIDTMVGSALAFINFTRNILLNESAMSLPKDRVVVELLEDIEPDSEVIEACKRLKENGYTLALDDFVYDAKFKPLLLLADVIKVDFRISGPDECLRMAQVFGKRGTTMLAEKVESEEEFQSALGMGYDLFQGYFFSRPILISRKELPSNKLHYLRLLRELNRPELKYNDLGMVIRSDVSMSFKLLRYINSASFGVRYEVSSISQALALLGEQEVRKWASLIALSDLGADKPPELVATSLIRARFSELLAPQAGMGERKADMFLMGLFSMLDALCDRPIEEVLEELPLADDMKGALTGEENRLGTLLGLVTSYERADWQGVSQNAASLGIPEQDIPPMYEQALVIPNIL